MASIICAALVLQTTAALIIDAIIYNSLIAHTSLYHLKMPIFNLFRATESVFVAMN